MALKKTTKRKTTAKKSTTKKRTVKKASAKKSVAKKSTGKRKVAKKAKPAKKRTTKKKSTRKYSPKAGKEVEKEMRKFKKGTAKSGKGEAPVESREQAIAIGLSKARKKGEKVPKKPA